MSKILVILGHPDSQSFNAAIFDAYVKNLDRQRHEVQTLQLGEMPFDAPRIPPAHAALR